ncbi:tRNA lysidine(34) synthetase TilS, partial [Streptomyces sp. SID625]|nr:tRNA lysidine(34) synthetase TilS [Streptomyces sp. SID625]
MGPHPAVAAIRLAVRRVLNDILDEQYPAPPPAGPPRPELQTAHAAQAAYGGQPQHAAP